jgi:hypothetical protein
VIENRGDAAPAAAAVTPPSRRPTIALALACAAALLAPLALPLVTGRVFVFNDLAHFNLPMRHLFQQALQAGDSPLWSPSIFGGFYQHGEGQTGMFHPLHQGLYRLFRLDTAFSLELVASYVAAFAGMVWLLRRLRLSGVAACAGALLFAFSGFLLLHYHHMNMVAVLAHLPWLLGAADMVVAGERPNERRAGFAALALLIGSAFLVGFPQAVWWDALALGAFALLRAAETGRWRALAPCAAALVLGVLIGGIQIVPTADAAAGSVRADGNPEFAVSFSLHPLNLVQLWSPYALQGGAYSERDYMWFHEFGIYSGALPAVALAWLWLRRRALPERRLLIVAGTAFAVVMVVLALGRYGGLARLLGYLPVLGSLRAPTRYIVLAQFVQALLAAVAVDDLVAIVERRVEAPTGRQLALWLPAGLGLATLLAANARLTPLGDDRFASVAAAAPGVAAFAVVTALVWLAGRRWRPAVALLLVVTAIDLGTYGIGFVRREPARSVRDLVAGVPLAPAAVDEAYAGAPGAGPVQYDILVLAGYRLTNGYAGLFPASVHGIDSPDAQRLGGARWRFHEDGKRIMLHEYVPRVRLLEEASQSSPSPVGSGHLTVDRPRHLTVQVDSPSPSRRVVGLTERFHAGWTATADGVALPTMRVDGDFLGVVVEPGARVVDLRFAPRSFTIGWIVSAIGVALLGVCCGAWPRWA